MPVEPSKTRLRCVCEGWQGGEGSSWILTSLERQDHTGEGESQIITILKTSKVLNALSFPNAVWKVIPLRKQIF